LHKHEDPGLSGPRSSTEDDIRPAEHRSDALPERALALVVRQGPSGPGVRSTRCLP
jgi:hypothetical protein